MSTSDFFSPRFHYTFEPHTPTLTIASGTRLGIICPDSDNALSDGTLLPTERRQSGEGVFQGNPCAGPMFVEGADVGDCLEVTIHAIELDRGFGQTGLAPNHGLLSAETLGSTPPSHLYRWAIDPKSGLASVSNPLGIRPIAVALRPFIGCIGVCPAQGSVSALMSGVHGGNMDIPLSAPSSKVLLPVFRPGGLLMLGDLHAAQGHGEIIGGGIETSGKVDCTLTVIKDRPIATPRFINDTSVATVGLDDDLRTAIARAYGHLLDWIVADYPLNRWDAYNLISQSGSIVIGNLGLPPYPVAACIERACLPNS